MRYLYNIVLGVTVLLSSASAQTLQVSFDKDFLQKQVGDQVQSTISITPPSDFKASIFLKVSSPTLPVTNKNLSDTILNVPFPKTVQLSYNISFLDSGSHKIIIEGKNGNLIGYDTLNVQIRKTEQWRLLGIRNTAIGKLYLRPEQNYFFPTMSESKAIVKVSDDSVSFIAGWENIQKPHGVMAQDTNNNFWISAANGLGMYDGNYWTVTQNPNNLVTSEMLFDNRNVLWFSSYSFSAPWPDWHLFSLKEGVLKRHDSIRLSLPNFYSNGSLSIHDISRDGAGNIWILASASMQSPVKTIIMKYDGQAWSTVEYPNIGLAYTNDDGGLRRMTFDKQGNMWIWYELRDSTNKEVNGLLKYNGTSWQNFQSDENYYSSLNMPLHTDNSGGVWFTAEKSLVRFDGNTFTSYNSQNSPLPATGGGIVAIDSNDNLWLGWGENTIIFNPNGITGLSATTAISNEDSDINIFKANASPNPAQNSTTIHYSLKAENPVSISIYNSLGIEVFKNNFGFKNSGDNSEIISTSEFPSGQYYYVLKAGAQQSTQPLVIVR
ncbi:MAG: T9SS type A sorting domain-containing protein [Bacteroidota bacterium]